MVKATFFIIVLAFTCIHTSYGMHHNPLFVACQLINNGTELLAQTAGNAFNVGLNGSVDLSVTVPPKTIVEMIGLGSFFINFRKTIKGLDDMLESYQTEARVNDIQEGLLAPTRKVSLRLARLQFRQGLLQASFYLAATGLSAMIALQPSKLNIVQQ